MDDYIKIDAENRAKGALALPGSSEPGPTRDKRAGLLRGLRESQFVRDLVNPRLRLQVWLVVLLNVLNQLTGINVFQLYSTIIFEKMDYADPENLTVVLGYMHLVAGLTTNQLIERMGRKALISLGLFLLCVCFVGILSGMLFELHWLGLLFIFGYKVSFCMACGGSIMVYQSEILPAHLIPFGVVFQTVFVILVSYATIPLVNSIGIFALFTVFLGIGLAGFVLFYGFAVETKEKKDSVVIEEFSKKRFWR